MKCLYMFMILFLLIIPNIVLGSRLTKDNEGLANYKIWFWNNQTFSHYEVITDDNGNFILDKNLLMDNNPEMEFVTVMIGKNLTKICNKPVRCIVQNIEQAGYFKIPENIEKLDIRIISGEGYTGIDAGFISHFVDMDGLEFISASLFNEEGLVYYDKITFDKFVTNYTLVIPLYGFLDKDKLLRDGAEKFLISHFMADTGEYDVVLSLARIKAQIVSITNPYDEPAKATIKTNDDNCLLNNGETEINEIFEGSETKSIPLFSSDSTQCDTNKVEVDFTLSKEEVSMSTSIESANEGFIQKTLIYIFIFMIFIAGIICFTYYKLSKNKKGT